MILHLYQEIPYLFFEQQQGSQKLAHTYHFMLETLDNSPVGSEACLKGSYHRTEDGTNLSVVDIGWANPPDEAMRKAVSEGVEHPKPKQEDQAFSIVASDYRFQQLYFTPDKNSIVMSILSFLSAPVGADNKEGSFYLRMIKENVLEVVVQLMEPLEK